MRSLGQEDLLVNVAYRFTGSAEIAAGPIYQSTPLTGGLSRHSWQGADLLLSETY
jgi:hypothetical protein